MTDRSALEGVLLVMPCYNEAHRLDVETIRGFMEAHPGLRLLFVDDGSTDGTGAILEGLRSARPGAVSIVTLPRNYGKAEAVRRGMLEALAKPARYVGYWDADLATPLEALRDFYNVLEDRPWIELAVGSRVQLLGREIVRRRARHYTGRAFATLASLILDLRVYDTQCGAKLFRAGPATRALFTEPFCTRWIFDVELFARLVRSRRGSATAAPVEQAVYEVPLTRWSDIAGSKLRKADFLIAVLDLLRVARTLRHPLPLPEQASEPEPVEMRRG